MGSGFIATMDSVKVSPIFQMIVKKYIPSYIRGTIKVYFNMFHRFMLSLLG